jgi:hypothetical protein
MTETKNSTSEVIQPQQMTLRARAGAAGKALLVYLGSGSVLLAVVAYLVFSGMGC